MTGNTAARLGEAGATVAICAAVTRGADVTGCVCTGMSASGDGRLTRGAGVAVGMLSLAAAVGVVVVAAVTVGCGVLLSAAAIGCVAGADTGAGREEVW